jgi:predicted hotdog family 3-hydroxylacyl-ACP dehydratase
MTLPLSGEDVVVLIPQKKPFLLIDKLLEVSKQHCMTSFVAGNDHVLVNDGKLTTAALIENIAQTCAAMAGYESVLAGKPIPIGFIGDVRHFECFFLPKATDEILTTVAIENKVFNVSILSGKIELNNNLVATCTMKIFVEDNTSHHPDL